MPSKPTLKQMEMLHSMRLQDANAKIAELERQQLAAAKRDGERMKSECIPKDDFMLWALDWRNIRPDEACKDCGGSGAKTYGSTSTWHGGIGGSAMTSDVCDKCWGSGNFSRPWTNLRQMKAIAARQKEGK